MAHVPVLLNRVLEILRPLPDKFIIDGTVDGGGHAAEIVKRLEPNGIFLGIDWDESMITDSKSRIGQVPKVEVHLVLGNYADLPAILKSKKLGRADGLLLDLGLSSEQLENSGKGFSFMKDEPLIMRYALDGPTAAEIINGRNEKELADVFFRYGEERYARNIAKGIIEARRKKRIITTFDLVEAIRGAVPKSYERGRIHPATRIFQALRIYVNNELGNLESVLKSLHNILKPGGVIIIISFHSLEDRIVKNYFRDMEKQGLIQIITKKPMVAEREEILINPRSRSAKLRAAIIKIPKY